ncbi:MAG TPA: NBR1-Ig-like domain-containing protein [Anaerolineales bacterium]|nr:NBR1-Ig-like domain-containing protein [Anaerolineales bacterium]
MNASNRWIIVVAIVGFFMIAALVPIAYLIGRAVAMPEPTPLVVFPTTTFVVFPTTTLVGVLSPTAIQVTEIPATVSQPPTTVDLPTATPPPTHTLLPTATPLPTNTPLPTFTFTPVPPTKTPTPSIPCNAASFVADVTIPDGSVFAPDADFEKVWRLKNVGSCTWSTSYTFNYVSGTDMANKKNETVNLPHAVKPGETVDIKAKLFAPIKPGSYTSNWLLKNASGSAFGAGAQANLPFDVKITVLNVDPNVAFDLSTQVCAAEWKNSNAKNLACPGAASGTDGFVVVLPNPSMEHRNENEPALWINPDHRSDGVVTGIYPIYNVKVGDHFRTTIGCLANSSGCNVTFELGYKKNNGNVFSLGTWTESFDGSVTDLDIDLSEIAGQNIYLMLTVRINNQKFDKANAFWFAPRVVNVP